MYRRRGLYTMVAIFTLAYFASVTIFWKFLLRIANTQSWPNQVALTAIFVLYLLLASFLWTRLSSRFAAVPDLTAFILIVFTVFYTAVAWIGWFIVNSPERRFDLVPIAAVGLYLWLLIVIRRWLDIKLENIQGGAVGVVQRHEVFHRLEKPGPIWIIGRMERIAYTINTGHRNLSFETDILRMGDLAYKYSIDVHYRLTPQTIPEPDDNKIKRLLADQRETTQTTIYDILRHATARRAVEQERTRRMDWFGALLLVIPGVQACGNLMQEVEAKTMNALTPKGIGLDDGQGIVIMKFHIPTDLKRELTPTRIRQLLKQRNPTGNDATVAQVLAWTEKAESLQLRLFTGGVHTTRPEVTPEKQSPPDTPPQQSAPQYSLSERDLGIMKRLPCDDAGVRQSSPSPRAPVDSIQTLSYPLSRQDLNVMKNLPC